MIKITVFPRIHITLIGMNNQGYRLNGGVGFSIKDPSIEISFQSSEIFNLIDKRKISFSDSESKKLINHLEAIFIQCNLSVKMTGTIASESPTHYGFGTSTSIRLAFIEALMILNKKNYDNVTIIHLSGRGGTSGIGINTYFNGGIVFDVGVKDKSLIGPLPSSAREDRSLLPLVLVREATPNWVVGLLIPKNISPKTEIEELEFFKSSASLDKDQVNAILYEVVYGVVSSVIESDVSSFCESINKIQNTAWKRAERQQYGSDLLDLERMLYDLGATCVGMSSLGPSLFFIAKNYDFIQSHVKDNEIPCTILITEFNNTGRRIEHD